MEYDTSVGTVTNYTYRIHQHFVLLVLFWIQHVVAFLAESDTDESRPIVVCVIISQ